MPNAINFGEAKVSESRAQYKEKHAFSLYCRIANLFCHLIKQQVELK